MDDERCPKCGSLFPASAAWAPRSEVLRLLSPALVDLDTRVRCPNCGLIFPATSYRFFGFLWPVAMRVFVAVLVLGIVGSAGYVLLSR
jgi:hypothetical protein